MNFREQLSREKRHFMSSYMPVHLTKELYKGNFGEKLDLKHPGSINEKLQYLKLHDYYNNPVVTNCIDKYRIRRYLTERGMTDLLPELYGAYNTPDQIPFEELPDQFVIKCNHGCGFNIICKDKKTLDTEDCKKKLEHWLHQDYWKEFGELQYKFIRKKIIVEQYLGDDISTFKFYCFNGMPKVMYMSANGENGEYDKYYDYFDMEWNHLDVSLHGHENRPDWRTIQKPKNFGKMKQTAALLCREFPFVRVDLYNIDGKIYISEMTFIPTGGFMHLTPEGTAEEWGSWLTLKTENGAK
ncbi:MAG: glycosyl transferase [Roseburia sp.]|nr:glycosyl transferase [Roseburia sp.]